MESVRVLSNPMEMWQALSVEVRTAIQAGAWIVGTWLLSRTLAHTLVAALDQRGWSRALDWGWLGRPVDEAPLAGPTSSQEDSIAEEPETEDRSLSTFRNLVVASAVAFGVRQAALLYAFTPAIAWVDWLLPVVWVLAAAAAGALLIGNRILRPLLPVVFSRATRERLDNFYPVPKGEQSFSTATQVLVGWVVYSVLFLTIITFAADAARLTTVSEWLATIWRFILTGVTIALIWFVALRAASGMDHLANENPDDSLAAGARATGRRALVFGVAGLATCCTLFDSAVWFVGPILFLGAAVCAWVLRHHVEDYFGGLYLRLSHIKRIRLAGAPCKVLEIRPFVSVIADDLETERLVPNARLVTAFRMDEGSRSRGRASADTPERSAYLPPPVPVTSAEPRTMPVEDAGGTASPAHEGPHPFGNAAAIPFDPDREYTIPGTTRVEPGSTSESK